MTGTSGPFVKTGGYQQGNTLGTLETACEEPKMAQCSISFLLVQRNQQTETGKRKLIYLTLA